MRRKQRAKTEVLFIINNYSNRFNKDNDEKESK